MAYKAGNYEKACVVGLLLSLMHNAYAVRADYVLGVQAEYTDNIALTETNTQNETTMTLLGGFLLEHSAADLEMDVRGLLEYANYLENTFDNETMGTLNASVEWRQLPGALHWVVEDYFTQTTINSAAPDIPSNRVNANAFAIGPDIIFRLAPATTLETHLRRMEYYYEDSNADSSRNAVAIGWVRDVRPQLALSANVAYEDAQFTEQDQSDFTKTDFFIRVDAQRGRSDLIADIGASKIERDAGDDVTGFLGRVSLGRQIRTNARLDLELSSQYTDSGTDLLTAGSTPFALDRTGEQISGDIFFDRRIEARYSAGTIENNWTAYVIARDEDYEILPQDRKSIGLRLNLHRLISQSTFLNVYGQYRKEKYLDLAQDNKDYELGIGLERQLARRITARLDYTYNTRDSNIVGLDYDENRVLFLIYFGVDPAQVH